MDYVVKIEKEFGVGVKPRDLYKVKKELREKKEVMERWRERLKRDHSRYNSDRANKQFEAEWLEANSGFEKAKKEYEDLEKSLMSGDVFGTAKPSETVGLITCSGELNLAELYDVYVETEGKTARLVVENYNDTTVVTAVGEGEEISKADIKNHVTVVDTDKDSIKKMAEILSVPETMLSDETDLLNGAIDSVQKKHFDNTNTYLLCKAVTTSKEAVDVDAFSLSNKVNTNLCSKAKRGAEIITNESGFDKLDVDDSVGNPLLKKDFSMGEFVFDEKYIVRTLSDEILPNNEDGSVPVLVGDWKNILRLAVVKEYPPLIKEDLYNCVVENRAIKKIIPILTTKSDKAFIVGRMQ